MVMTGYFKTQKIPAARVIGWHITECTINQAGSLLQKGGAVGNVHYDRTAPKDTTIYCHDASATEPVTDGSLNTTDFTGESDKEYSGAPGFIHSFTTETGFFSSNQNLDLGTSWTIKYNVKASNVTAGKTAYVKFMFYKRDADRNDTFLFEKKVNAGALYSVGGYSTTVTPAGNVTTADRLRIRVYTNEEVI